MLVLSHFEFKKSYINMPDYQLVHRYEHSNVWRFCAILYDCSESFRVR